MNNNYNDKKIWCIIILVFILITSYGIYKGIHKKNTNVKPVDGNINSVSSLTVTPKKDDNDNDLLITHTYKATIDNEEIKLPVRTVPSYSSSDSDSATPDTVTFKQELDITPLVKDYEKKKNYEIGIGIGVHDNDVYIPISLQRNFSKDKALECIAHVEDKGITGGEVLYKKRF